MAAEEPSPNATIVPLGLPLVLDFERGISGRAFAMAREHGHEFYLVAVRAYEGPPTWVRAEEILQSRVVPPPGTK